jgi:hypothetical protein
VNDTDPSPPPNARRGVPLPPREAERYVNYVAKRRLPVVENGRVIGSLPFPPAGPPGGDLVKRLRETQRLHP